MIETMRALIEEIENQCPCGARPESLNTHPHIGGCPVARLKEIFNSYFNQKLMSGSATTLGS
jgi:hypothetical protein